MQSAGTHLFAAAALLLATVSAEAQEAPAAGQDQAPKAAWPVTCKSVEGSTEMACSMSQVISTKEGGQRVIAAIVLRDKEGRMAMRLNLPHGLLLPKGVSVGIDEAERKAYPIVTADKNGSYAVIAVDEALAASLTGGKVLNIAVSRYSGGEVLFKLTLEGFAAGYAKL